jgi:ComF family protein
MPTSALDVVRELASGLESFFFPSLCRACGAELSGRGARLLCAGCLDELLAPLPEGWREVCGLGGDGLPRFGRHSYEGPAGEAVRLLKFGGKKRMAPLLAAGIAPLAAELRDAYRLDALVPVPLHPLRRRERRFNQAEEMGGRVARAAALAFRPRGLARTVNTRPQVELSGEDRLANVVGAFAPREGFVGIRVLLLDDVITTGATVGECARALREAGAAGVVAVAAAGPGLKEPLR